MSVTEAVRDKPKLLDELPQRLHHHAYVVRDQEKNRQFFEDLLGIPLVATWCESHHNSWLNRDVAMCVNWMTTVPPGSARIPAASHIRAARGWAIRGWAHAGVQVAASGWLGGAEAR